MDYLADPHTTCKEEEEKYHQECMRDAYNHYISCKNSCSK
jgi:hypothetical protein